MKRLLLIISVIVLSIFGYQYIDVLKGILPLIKPSPVKIAEIENDLPLNLPEGFQISIFAKNLSGARVIVKDFKGNFWVSQTKEGKVSLLEVQNGKIVNIKTIFQNLNHPHGLAFDPDNPKILYIAEEDKISKTEIYREKPILEKIIDLPAGGRHFTRTIAFGPDKKLYVSIGSSCDVCFEKDERRAAIYSMNKDGSDFKLFARGLRNAVFFTWHPKTKKMWATEMGRDYLGDNLPPDEINIVEEDKNYGWPICYGKNIHDSEFDKNVYIRNPCMEPFETPSYIDLPAHSAPLGLAFIPETENWPKEYWNDLLVAYHGSWNRSVPTGYKIVRIPLDENDKLEGEIEDFITGWLTKEGVWGRPVDILIDDDGIMYLTDNKAGVVYKVIYEESKETISMDQITSLIKESIIIETPKENEKIASPLVITGKAKGFWFFEGSFSVKLYDNQGKELGKGQAKAESNWMTEDLVPFTVTIDFTEPTTESGVLVFENSNPSGLPENSLKLEIPIRFVQNEKISNCIVTGCSGQICSDKEVFTTCEWKPEYKCYRNAICERQLDGNCGWTVTEELKNCLEKYKNSL